MKKALLLLLIVPMLFVSCGGGLSSLINRNWFYDSTTDSDGTTTTYPVSMSFELLGETITVQTTGSFWFTDAGTGYLKMATKTGDKIETAKSNFVYEGDDKTITITFSDGDMIGEVWGPFEYSISGSTLTCTAANGSMILTERNMPNFE